jgi:hypothetical protein
MTRNYPVPLYHRAPSSPAEGALEVAKFGAVVGLCGAGAHNLHRLRRHEIELGAALAATVRGALVSGLAAGTAGLVAGAFRPSPMLSLLATIATGTAVAYALTQESQPQVTGDDHG